MRRNSYVNLGLLISALACAAIATAQKPPPQGTFRFVNVSEVKEPTTLTIDGAKLRPDGFKPSEATGTIGILAGPHQLEATAPGATPGRESVTIEEHASVTAIAYSVPVVDPRTKQSVPALRLFALRTPPRSTRKQFQVVYASHRPQADLVINGSSRVIPAFQAVQLEAESLKVEQGGKDVLKFVARESGSFVAVIYDKADGTLGGVLLPDYS